MAVGVVPDVCEMPRDLLKAEQARMTLFTAGGIEITAPPGMESTHPPRGVSQCPLKERAGNPVAATQVHQKSGLAGLPPLGPLSHPTPGL